MKTRKFIRHISLALVLVLLISMLAACGSAEPDPHAGVYNAETAEALGITLPISSVFDGAFTIELKNGGKCKISIGDDSASGKWTLDGENLTVSGGGVEIIGTLIDNVIRTDTMTNRGEDISQGVVITFVRSAD